MKFMKLWPFPIFRIYKTNERLTEIFLKFVESETLELVMADQYYTVVKCEHGTLKVWTANRFYAYASKGIFTDISGEIYRWCDIMPSRYAVRKMHKAILKLNPKNLTYDYWQRYEDYE